MIFVIVLNCIQSMAGDYTIFEYIRICIYLMFKVKQIRKNDLIIIVLYGEKRRRRRNNI